MNLNKEYSSINEALLLPSPSMTEKPIKHLASLARNTQYLTFKSTLRLQYKYEKYYARWRNFDLFACVFSMIGLFMATIDYESNFHYPRLVTNESSLMKIMTAITTAFTLAALVLRHVSKKKWLRCRVPRSEQMIYDAIIPEHLLINKRRIKSIWTSDFIFDLAICAIHPIAYYDVVISVQMLDLTKTFYMKVDYLLSDFLYAFMFCRFYLVLRNIFNFSLYTDIHAKVVCQRYGFTANTRFGIKCLTIKKPEYVVIFSMMSSITILAILLRIFERPFGSSNGFLPWESIISSIWCVVITMTTVGYGDIAPSTVFGRTVCVLTSFWGGFLISLMIVCLSNILEFNSQQRSAFLNLTLTRTASKSIVTGMRYLLSKKYASLEVRQVLYDKMRDALCEFSNAKRQSGIVEVKQAEKVNKDAQNLKREVYLMRKQLRYLIKKFDENTDVLSKSFVNKSGIIKAKTSIIPETKDLFEECKL